MKLLYEYDAIGRKTGLRRDSATGTKLAEWTYDRLVNGTEAPGLAASSTRFVNGNAYTTNILEYDAAKQALRQEIVIPASEGALAGRYEFTNTYKEDGEVNRTKLPAVGGLPEETLRYGYNEQGMPVTLSGLTGYVTSTTYTEYGEQERVVLSTGGKWLARDFQYEVERGG